MSRDAKTVSPRTVRVKQGSLACGPSVKTRVGRSPAALSPRRHAHRCETAGGGVRVARPTGEVYSDARHTLQTPLTSIKAFAEILLANPDLDAEERQRYLRIVVEESERLSRRIDEMLAVEIDIDAGSNIDLE